MSELNPGQEQLIADFVFDLCLIDGPDDMFPPDDTEGVREPRRPIAPTGWYAESVGLAAAYNLTEARQNRRQVARRTCALLHEIDLVTV